MTSHPTTRIVFVCLGNICRSPTAEGIFIALANQAGRADEFVIDSAGTGGWHAGQLADPRSRAIAKQRGVELTHRARQFTSQDFAAFDLVIAMDRQNQRDLEALATNATQRAQIKCLRAYEQDASHEAADLDVPDPYYGELDEFDRVYGICQRACAALLAAVPKHS